MGDDGLLRIGREIFVAALGLPLDSVDPWVIDRMTLILDDEPVHSGQTLFTAGAPVEYLVPDGVARLLATARNDGVVG